ncbi:Putative trans-acting enoyl reductase [Thalassocella blandensis]|nr:Putative trans-acting enoyl reductase [Thalassocella blandensis]
MSQPPFDIVVFGASSFVGQILVRYLAKTYGDDQTKLRWAIAGRNINKLDDTKKAAKAEAIPVLIADAKNESQIRTLCDQTRVVVSTVGPYALYGETLLKTCCESGTDYCDLTGELHWLLQMVSKYQELAGKTGARIVNCCGFDSIPSDLGVYYTLVSAEDHFGKVCNEVNMRVTKLRGKFSGGTYASMFNAIDELSANPKLRKALANPYCLCPSDHPFEVIQPHTNEATYDLLTDSWTAPFVMAGLNTRVVHRSNSQFGNEYGLQFKYDEAVVAGKGPKGRKRASKISFGLKMLGIVGAIPPLRWLAKKFFIPKPGQGPTPAEQEKGAFVFSFDGFVEGMGSIHCTVTGSKDPGYGATGEMLGEAAVCLAKDVSKEDKPGGFWTPANIFHDLLIDRLNANTCVKFTLDRIDDKRNKPEISD